jgi:hypothetical protein
MRPLNPYGGEAGAKSIFELEDENFTDKSRTERRQLHCLAISSKRYSLFNLSEHGEPELRAATEPDRHTEEEARAPVIRKRSDHGLGYLVNPLDPDSSDRDWIMQGWEWIVRDALGLHAPEPEWFGKPALMRYSVTTPGLLRCFEQYNAGKPRRQQVRPFNFFMVAQEKQLARDKAGDLHVSPITGQCALIAHYESDPERWERLEWTNRYQPESSYRITTDPRKFGSADNLLAARTLRDVFEAYRDSPEPKSLAPDGQPAGPETRGLLRRRHVKVASITSIGKEMNALEEQLAGIRQTEDERHNTYRRPGHDPFNQTRQTILALREPVEKTARGARVSTRTVKRARAGQNISADSQHNLMQYARRRAGVTLQAAGIVENWRNTSTEAMLATYLDWQHTPTPPTPQLCACGCGQPVKQGRRGPPAKWHSDACRKRAARQTT